MNAQTAIYLCLHSGSDSVYQMSVSKLCDWLITQRTDPELIHLLRQYILSRGSRPMSSICCRQMVHYKAQDGLTERHQLKIMRQCEALLCTDPSILQPSDRQLLDLDFEALGDGLAVHRQL
jgi:hypothetical protein